MAKEKVLVIDDEKSIRKTTKAALEAEEYYVDTAEDGKEGIEKIKTGKFDVILLDLILPDTNGMEILHHTVKMGFDTIVIVITGHGSIESAVEAVKLGAYHYITKPVDFENLKHLINEALEKKRLIKENLMLRETLDSKGSFSGVVGQSKKIKDVIEIVKLSAKSENNVLIIGETGTGKELVADAIHYNSKRKNNNYMKINCAALPETILESELFGHEKGAFTDAKEQKKGIFELSDKGSILFDEIGCMSRSTQSKLLRVIEDQKVRRIGNEKEFQVNVRIISSTNEDLEKVIEKGTFRADLFYRLNVIKIEVPPLRERKEDIPLLVKYFINLNSKLEKKEAVAMAPEAMEILLEHDWPGNIRELENTIRRAFIFNIEKNIEPSHLPQDLKKRKSSFSIQIPNGGIKFKDFTAEVVKQTLEKAQGNRTKAAEMLGVSRPFIRKYLPKE